jgi:hypothetical protein
MKKLEKFLLGVAILFPMINITIWVIINLWETPNDVDIIHNLFIISSLGTVVSLGQYILYIIMKK